MKAFLAYLLGLAGGAAAGYALIWLINLLGHQGLFSGSTSWEAPGWWLPASLFLSALSGAQLVHMMRQPPDRPASE